MIIKRKAQFVHHLQWIKNQLICTSKNIFGFLFVDQFDEQMVIRFQHFESIWCFNQLSIKMYGVSQELMQRMQRRIKEKIYREMLEEEQRRKRNQRQSKPNKEAADPRFKTQPDYNDSDYEPHKNQRKNEHPHFIKEESTFLPIIGSNRKNFDSDGEGQKSRNPEYEGYVSRRQRRMSRQQKQTQRRRASTSATFQHQKLTNTKNQDSEEQKTEQYLNQCEEIISNLRQLTRKNKEKINKRQNKYEGGNPGKQSTFSPQLKSFRGSFGKNSQLKSNSHPPKYYQQQMAYSSLSNPLKNTEPTYNSSWDSNPDSLSYSFNNEFNESSSFDLRQKERPNVRKISPPRVRIQDLKKKALPIENEGFKEKARQNCRRLSPIRNTSPDEIEENKQEEENENNQQEEGKNSNGKGSKNQLAKQNKRQKAIVKYLKKARLRGNLLYQKVQSRKGDSNGDPNSDPNDPNADPNANPSADPKDPKADPNAKSSNNPKPSNDNQNNGKGQNQKPNEAKK